MAQLACSRTNARAWLRQAAVKTCPLGGKISWLVAFKPKRGQQPCPLGYARSVIDFSAASGCRDGDTVGWNNLRLIGKDFASLGIDEHFQPMDIVDAIFLVITESLYTGEVFQALALGVEKRLINAEIVRIAVNVGNGLAEGDDFRAESQEELHEAVGLAIGFREGVGIANRASGAIRGVESGIGLRNKHHGRRTALLGF